MIAPSTGGRQCGSTRYAVTAEPIRSLAWHCKECQRQSVSAFALSMPMKKDSLTATGLTKQITRRRQRQRGDLCVLPRALGAN
jgi:hypothetical protein